MHTCNPDRFQLKVETDAEWAEVGGRTEMNCWWLLLKCERCQEWNGICDQAAIIQTGLFVWMVRLPSERTHGQVAYNFQTRTQNCRTYTTDHIRISFSCPQITLASSSPFMYIKETQHFWSHQL